MCVAPPTHVGAWSMALLLGQPFEYYYYLYTVEPPIMQLSMLGWGLQSPLILNSAPGVGILLCMQQRMQKEKCFSVCFYAHTSFSLLV